MPENGSSELDWLAPTTEESVRYKLRTYLLNPNHSRGRDKARWFRSALGFTQDNYEELAQQIYFDPLLAVGKGTSQYGTRYQQITEIHGANGNVVRIRCGWIRNIDGVVRLVSAYPHKEKKS